MKVCLLHDDPGYVGGAELTMKEFRLAAPEKVEVTNDLDADAIVIGNCASFDARLIDHLKGKRVVWYHNDLSPHVNPELREWLNIKAEHIFCSPIQRERYGVGGYLVPPAINLSRFRPTRQTKRNTERQGTVSIGAWQNMGKGQQLLREWSDENGPVTVFGDGPYVPAGPNIDYQGILDPEQVPQVLWSAERFIHLPTALEPFGRGVVEAHAADCEVIANRNVGAFYWLEQKPDCLATAARDFWSVVCPA